MNTTKLAYNTKVSFDYHPLKGSGLIKGWHGDLPVLGVLYIVEILHSSMQIPNQEYLYTHVIIPECRLLIESD